VFLLAFTVFLIAINRNNIFVLQKNQIPIQLRIGNYTAWNISKKDNILNLGTVKADSFSKRNLDITNTYPFPTKFEFNVKGNISELIIYPEVVYLDAWENKSIPFITDVIKNDTKQGLYEGIIEVTVKRFFGKISD